MHWVPLHITLGPATERHCVPSHCPTHWVLLPRTLGPACPFDWVLLFWTHWDPLPYVYTGSRCLGPASPYMYTGSRCPFHWVPLLVTLGPAVLISPFITGVGRSDGI